MEANRKDAPSKEKTTAAAAPPAKGEKAKKPEAPSDPFILSASPHISSGESIRSLMNDVILALVPGLLVGIYYFGMDAVRVIAITTASAVAFEAATQRLMGRPVAVSDMSAVLTGVLLAMNLPTGSPWWICVIGSAVAIVIAKQLYGGIGYNIFNPALVARVVLLISWPVQMTTWPEPKPFFQRGVDTITGATSLGKMKESLLLQGDLSGIADIRWIDPFLGHTGGSLGEISAVALALGGIYLIARRVITWHIPVSYLGSVLLMAAIFHQIDPNRYAPATFHLVTGGLMLGAFYMATDLVTSPVTYRGMLIFGAGCGIITLVIRYWGGYPEGVSFAILLMNAATPLIDRWVKPKTFGTTPQMAGAGK
jgi:electron transport complex protein RnfD